MAPKKDPSRQNEGEKTDASRHAGPVRTDEPLRDPDLASEHEADLSRDAERVEADRAIHCKSAIQTLLVIYGEWIWEEAARNAKLKEMKDCASKEKLRTKQSNPSDSGLTLLLQKGNGAIIRHPSNLPLNYYPRNKRGTKTKTALTTRKNSSPL